MRLPWLYLALLLITGSLAAQTAPSPLLGISREEVIELFGQPTNQLRGGNREVLVYPAGRVVLEAGRVTALTVPPPEGIQTYHPWSLAPAAKSTDVHLTPRVRIASKPKTPEADSGTGSFIREFAHFAETRWGLTVGTIGALVVLFAAYRWGKRSAHAASRPRPSNHTSPMLQKFDPIKTRTPMRTRPPMMAKPVPEPAIPGVEPKPAGKGQEPTLQLTERVLNRLEWRRLEMLISRYYEELGHLALRKQVSLESTLDMDVFEKGEDKPYLRVRCKGWVLDKLGTRFVREFAEDLLKEGILRGELISATDFNSEARALGEFGQIELVSAAQMIKRIEALPDVAVRDLNEAVLAGDFRTPTCVRCNVKMILGTDGGRPAWTCRNTPVCTVTLPVRASVD